MMKFKNIIFNIIFAILTLLIVIFFYRNILLTTLLLIVIALIALIKWKSKLTLIIFLVGGIFGTFSEMIAINYGIWNYSIINFINIPFWLFIVWGNTAAFIYQTSLEFRKLGFKK